MKEDIRHDQQAVAWIDACLDLSTKKSEALMRNDLSALERCLEDEAMLLAGRPTRNSGQVPKEAVARLRFLNERNRALTENGLEFSRVMLDAIRPPATYCGLASGRASGRTSAEPRNDGAHEPLLSVKC